MRGIVLRRLRLGLGLFAWGFSVAFTLLNASSYFAYTTAGFDFETPTAEGIDVLYYRLRWDDGSVWIGSAIQPVARPDRRLDWFDPGGTLFATPTRPRPRSRWNRWGFWLVANVAEDPYEPIRYPWATSSRWWACPAWLFLVPWSFWLVRLRQRIKSGGGRGEAGLAG